MIRYLPNPHSFELWTCSGQALRKWSTDARTKDAKGLTSGCCWARLHTQHDWNRPSARIQCSFCVQSNPPWVHMRRFSAQAIAVSEFGKWPRYSTRHLDTGHRRKHICRRITEGLNFSEVTRTDIRGTVVGWGHTLGLWNWCPPNRGYSEASQKYDNAHPALQRLAYLLKQSLASWRGSYENSGLPCYGWNMSLIEWQRLGPSTHSWLSTKVTASPGLNCTREPSRMVLKSYEAPALLALWKFSCSGTSKKEVCRH